MYHLLTYPMQVISTNRIIGTQIVKEASENLPREFVAIYERGALKSGLYRGLLPGIFAAMCWKDLAW